MKLILWSNDSSQQLAKQLEQPLAQADLPLLHLPIEDTLPNAGEGDVVLGMGKKALDVLIAHGLAPKNRTLSSMRYPCVTLLPSKAECALTYSAGIGDLNYEWYVNMRIDVNLAIRRVKTGKWAPKLGSYKWVTSLDWIIESVEKEYAKTGKPVDVAFDTETVGLDPYDPSKWIVMLQFSAYKHEADCLHFPTAEAASKALSASSQVGQQVRWLLNSPKVTLCAANGKYDLNWLYLKHGIECTNFRFDTMLVGSLLDENRGNSLNLHTKWYVPELGGYDDEFNKKVDKSRMDKVPPDMLLNYGGGDADACRQVKACMKQELLRDQALAKFYVNVLHPAARAYEKVERTGLLVDVPYYLQLESEVKAEMADLQKQGMELLGGRLIAKHVQNLSLTKASLITDYMFSPRGLNLKPKMLTDKTKQPSTSLDHLEMFKDHPDAAAFVKILSEYSGCQKTLSTYVVKRDEDGKIVGGFLSHLRADGRFHATHFLFNGMDDKSDLDGGTNTGRISVKEPAVQTIPKHTKWAKRLRRAIIAPPGMVILSNDYSQGELRIAACLFNEETMIQAYRDGKDLHALTGAQIGGVDWETFKKWEESPIPAEREMWAKLRQQAKAGNFGLLYGMGAKGFVDYAYYSYGVVLTLQEAELIRDTFFATYPGLSTGHAQYKKWARDNGGVRSPLGRFRHLPLIYSKDDETRAKAERQSINSPVQGTLSDFSLWATALIDKSGGFEEAPVVAMIHDQLISYVPEDWVPYVRRNKQIMENLPFHELGWQPQLQFVVDAEIGLNLGEMKKKKAGVDY